VKGDVHSLRALRGILDEFSLATGLTINFHKSTFVPLHVRLDAASAMADILGCEVSSFPQTYLGLPLSPHKLCLADFQPLVSKFDGYLAGWKARLLSSGGRLILVNAVLSSLSIYHLSSVLLPKTVIEMLDALRRAFLWTGEGKCHASNCLGLIRFHRIGFQPCNKKIMVDSIKDPDLFRLKINLLMIDTPKGSESIQ
jgi:hypothetical protein